MGFGEKILSTLGYHKIANAAFMIFTGNSCTPAFTLHLGGLPGARKAYTVCSPVATIINRLASSMANGKWWILDENSNDVSKSNRAVASLIQNPNPFQTIAEFTRQLDLYRNLYGEAYVYAVIPEGFKSAADAVGLWLINPERIEPVYKQAAHPFLSRSAGDIIEKYIISSGRRQITVNPAHVLHIRDLSLDAPFEKNGKRRLDGLEYEIKNICQAQEAIYSLNKDRGAQGIITNRSKDITGSLPISPEEKKQILEEYNRLYGLSRNQSKIIISDKDLGWQAMTFSVRDLMLIEGIKQNIESIADAFNYPFELLANQKGTTFANRGEAIKYLYQDNIIPSANIYAEKFTAFFGLQNVKIDIDFSHVEYMKQAEKEKAEALLKKNQALQIAYRLKIITREEWREIIDLDEQPDGNTYYESGKETDEAGETSGNEPAGLPAGSGENQSGKTKGH
jgi:HK97 family phage portal protein